jgi:hypothetical protein
VIDTRNGSGAFSGLLNPPVDVVNSRCGVPSTAQAYVFNATVVPVGGLELTLWPNPGSRHTVSMLNAADGWIISNLAIVPSTDGKTEAYVSGSRSLFLTFPAICRSGNDMLKGYFCYREVFRKMWPYHSLLRYSVSLDGVADYERTTS